MDFTTATAIYVPAFLTLVLALGAVFVFRGSYYKSLAQRVDQLEEKDISSYREIQKLRAENETLRRLVTGEMALEQLITLYKEHETKADQRNEKMLSVITELDRLVRTKLNEPR